MEMETNHRGQCWFCFDPIPSRKSVISPEDLKIYQDIFECSKIYVKEEEEINRFSVDWSNSEGLLTPFCTKCFKSAEIIHGVSQKLEEIQENLKMLIETFTCDVKERVSKNLKEKSSLIKVEDSDGFIEEEINFIFDEGDEYFIEHSEEMKFSENMLSNILQSGDNEQFSSNDMQDARCVDEHPFDKERKIKKSNCEEANNVFVRGKRKMTVTATNNLEKTAKFSKDSNSLCDNHANERNSISDFTYQPVYIVNKNKEGDFLCDICGGPFKNEYRVLIHRSSHNGEHEKPFKCQVCGEGFNSESEFLCHIHYECSLCGKAFKNRKSLNMHKAEFHGTKKEKEITNQSVFLQPCDRESKASSSLTTHNTDFDNSEAGFKCSVCQKYFKSISLLKQHIIAIHSEKQFQCNSCDSDNRYATKNELRQHILYAHEESSKKCNKCGKVCRNEADLKDHVIVKHGPQKYFACEMCDSKFKFEHVLKRHIQISHEKILNTPQLQKSFACEMCDSKYKYEADLRKHMQRGHEKIVKFQCDSCGKSFRSSKGKKYHEQTHLSDRQKFKCEICGDKYFVNLKNLTSHQKLTHTVFTDGYTREKCFTCEICGKTFSWEASFKRHLRGHTGERPFSCDVCGFAFALPTTLKKHILTHTGEKPHKCTFCEKYFRQSHQLKTHLRIHTGERPYSCEICGLTFSDRSTWYKHDKRHKQNS